LSYDTKPVIIVPSQRDNYSATGEYGGEL
jgi:hypothetical protein